MKIRKGYLIPIFVLMAALLTWFIYWSNKNVEPRVEELVQDIENNTGDLQDKVEDLVNGDISSGDTTSEESSQINNILTKEGLTDILKNDICKSLLYRCSIANGIGGISGAINIYEIVGEQPDLSQGSIHITSLQYLDEQNPQYDEAKEKYEAAKKGAIIGYNNAMTTELTNTSFTKNGITFTSFLVLQGHDDPLDAGVVVNGTYGRNVIELQSGVADSEDSMMKAMWKACDGETLTNQTTDSAYMKIVNCYNNAILGSAQIRQLAAEKAKQLLDNYLR